MLRNLIMKYDGLGNYIINFCIEMLEICISNQSSKFLSKYVDFTNNKPLENLKIEDRLDISLLILALLENYLKHFPNQR